MSRLACIVAAATFAIGCGDNGKLNNVVTGSTDFGLTDCGTAGDPRVVVVANPGGATFTFTTSLGSGSSSIYTVNPPSGVLLPNNEVELTLSTKPIPAVSATTENLYGDTLTVTTSLASDKPHVIPIKQTAHGAVLQLSSPTVDFPTAAPISAAAQTMPLTITNAGNSDTTVTVPRGVSFTLSPNNETITAGAAVSTTVSFSPLALGAISETLALQATGPQCGPLPSLTATATGTLTGTAKAVAMSSARGRPRNGGDLSTLCAIVSGGFVACTGDNTFGQRGEGQGTELFDSTFNLVVTASGATLDQVTHIDGGRNRFCALRQAGDIWCWGDVAAVGMHGNGGGDAVQTTPGAVQAAGAGNLWVATRYGFTCLVNGSNTVSCVAPALSRNASDLSVWTAINATAVSTNTGGGLALINDGTVVSFGLNTENERGLSGGNTPNSNDPPSSVDGLSNIIQVSAGGSTADRSNSHHSCAVDSAGNAWCWGRNRHGELGNGVSDGANTATPGMVMTAAETSLAGATWISAGQAHTCAVAAGSVYCWGRGSEGQLGLPVCTETVTTGCTNENNGFALEVPGITNATSVVASTRGTCAVLTTGGITCWGNVPGFSAATPTAIAAFGP